MKNQFKKLALATIVLASFGVANAAVTIHCTVANTSAPNPLDMKLITAADQTGKMAYVGGSPALTSYPFPSLSKQDPTLTTSGSLVGWLVDSALIAPAGKYTSQVVTSGTPVGAPVHADCEVSVQ